MLFFETYLAGCLGIVVAAATPQAIPTTPEWMLLMLAMLMLLIGAARWPPRSRFS
ncbi:hypothetical protein NOR53_542 [gamma proteobacterium NOR5-3]|nr:hypothetical protein NOR53_542 [gamma proteobacterium NOR5-3]